MKKIVLLLLGFSLGLVGMESPEGHKAKERIEREKPSSGTVAQSSASTAAISGIKSSSDLSSETGTEMAEIDLDSAGHTLTKAAKRRSILTVNTSADVLDADLHAQILQLLEIKRAQDAQKVNRAHREDRKENRKSLPVFFQDKQPHVPALDLSDLEGQKQELKDEELVYILNFISAATGRNITRVQERLKDKIKQVHGTPPTSELFKKETFKEEFAALTQVRQLANQFASTTSRVNTLKTKRPDTPQEIRAANPLEIIEHTGYQGMKVLLDLIDAEKDTKLQDTDTIKGRYKRSAVVSVLINLGALAWAIYQQVKGDNHPAAATCAPFNTTM